MGDLDLLSQAEFMERIMEIFNMEDQEETRLKDRAIKINMALETYDKEKKE